MKWLFGSCILLVCIFCCSCVFAQQEEAPFKKVDFYNAMSGGNEEMVNKQLELLKAVALTEKNAYEGALLMKKAGMVNGPGKKLNLFKEGHNKLEAGIQKDSLNVEFRFLRLMIQEQAPGILGYKGALQKDRLYIKNNFKKLPAIAQESVLKYSKASKILKPADL